MSCYKAVDKSVCRSKEMQILKLYFKLHATFVKRRHRLCNLLYTHATIVLAGSYTELF